MVREKILTAHRITSPEIFGIMTPGKLGGKDEVTDAYLLFINTVVRPFQQTTIVLKLRISILQNVPVKPKNFLLVFNKQSCLVMVKKKLT
jgi:hypothetical protein